MSVEAVLAAFCPVNVGGIVETFSMNLFTDLHTRVAAISGLLPAAVTVEALGAAVQSLDDTQVMTLTELTTQARQALEQISLATSAVISARSSREAGHAGLAQSRGFRTPTALIQQVTGVSRTTAMQQIRVGEALMAPDAMVETIISGDGDGDGVPVVASVRQTPWHEPLTVAFRGGALSSAQHDAITRGLGEPPTPTAATSGLDADPTMDPVAADPATIEAWSLAATQLASYAAEVPVEELAKQARAIRDMLDPEGADARFAARYEQRSFRLWTDSDGLTHGKFIFDDESAEWVRTIIDAALRPRRGGPRFVTADEQAKAAELKNDPRTNEQLTHDLLLDVLKAGAVADAATVFGVRQAGIKLVQVVNRDEYLADRNTPVTRFQESGITLPHGVGAKQRCNTGVQQVTVDEAGNPLDVGREQRLFTAKQRIALAIRDGGCRWTGCDRPASYCEAHHIDHWDADHGRTDIDRGVQLCAFHHLQLHNNGWKISRDGLGPFLLHPPPGTSAAKTAIRARSKTESFETSPSATRARSPEKPELRLEGTSVSSSRQQSGHGPAKDQAALAPAAPPQQNEPAKLHESAELAEPIELRPPLPLTYAWQLVAPPSKRFRTAA